MSTHIHFHSSDERFCGTREQMRQCTLDPNKVSCPACKDRDGFVISASGLAYLREIAAIAKAEGTA